MFIFFITVMRLELAPSAQMLRVYEWLDSGP